MSQKLITKENSVKSPPYSALDFMIYLFSTLVINHKESINLDDVIPTIYYFKEEECAKSIYNEKYFRDIDFTIDWNLISSDGISRGLSALQAFGVISLSNPSYQNINIKINSEDAEEFLNCDSKSKKFFESLANKFIEISY